MGSAPLRGRDDGYDVTRSRFFTGTVAVVGVLMILTGCGSAGGSGHKANSGPAPKPLEVIDRMRADVQAAVRPDARPGAERAVVRHPELRFLQVA